jgi:hypothetical protein
MPSRTKRCWYGRSEVAITTHAVFRAKRLSGVDGFKFLPRRFPGPLTVIAWEARRQLRDATSVDRAVVTPGEKRRERR